MPVSNLSFEPNPDGTCRACRGPVDPVTLLCRRCGAAHGERNRCPHCRTIARTLPHAKLLHRCSVCGKPRLPPSASATAGHETALQLSSAGYLHRVGTALAVASYVALGVGVPLLLAAVLLLAFITGLEWAIVLGLALPPLLLGLFLRIRSKTSLTNRDHALELAYSTAIIDLLRSDSVERTAESIAELMKLPNERTEALLSRLNADDQMISRVTDDGELLFGVPSNRLRVAGEPSTDIVDAEFEASEAEKVTTRR